MPVLSNLGEGDQFRTIGDVGRYIPTQGPLAGPARGSPGGLPYQARDVSPFVLTRERVMRELEDNPATARAFDVNTTAEVGADPTRRRLYQAATIDRAVQSGRPLGATIGDPSYYPGVTLRASRPAGLGPDPALWEGANPANFATGNASYDPKTGRWVGFAGGPQTATGGSGRSTELFGIEGPQGLEYARIMGYLGPDRTPIGPGGPAGGDASGGSLPPAGWQTTVAAVPGYVPPAAVPQGVTTAVDLAPTAAAEGPGFWQRFLGAFGDMPMKAPARPVAIPTPQLNAFRFTPVGRSNIRGV
jgi:hypothetical protein